MLLLVNLPPKGTAFIAFTDGKSIFQHRLEQSSPEKVDVAGQSSYRLYACQGRPQAERLNCGSEKPMATRCTYE
jgi:hypothetical protein